MDDPFPAPTSAAPGEDLPLDPALIKVLASDSRRDILRHLAKRRMTLTELAAALDLKKATVLEHLKKLADANLIRRLEDDRLWVYYELTRPGLRIVSPGRTRFYLIMGATAAACLLLGGAIAAAVLLHEPGIARTTGPSSASGVPAPESAPALPAADASGSSSSPGAFDLRSQGTLRAYRGLDGPVPLAANATGNGAFLVASTSTLDSVTVPATDGSGTLSPAQLDLLPPARYTLQYAPANTSAWVPAGDLTVLDPAIVATPLRVVEGAPFDLAVALPAQAPTPTVTLGGLALPGVRTEALMSFRAPALDAGNASLGVGRAFSTRIAVVPNATLDVGAYDGRAWNVTVRRNGTAASDARVAFAGAPEQTTDANGTARLAPASGTQALHVVFADGASFDRALVVDASAVRAIDPAPEVRSFTLADGIAHVSVASGVGAPIAFGVLVDDAPVDARVLPMGAGVVDAYDVKLATPLDAREHTARLVADVGPLVPVRMRENGTLGAVTMPQGDTGGASYAAYDTTPADGPAASPSPQAHKIERGTVLAQTSFFGHPPIASTVAATNAGPVQATNAPAAKAPGPGVALGLAAVAAAAIARRAKKR